MRKMLMPLTAFAVVALAISFAAAEDKASKPADGAQTAAAGDKKAKIGEAAPAFSLQDQNGKTVSLSDFAGKVVVLEWFNNECPYVVKHYSGGAMNATAKKYADKDVVWL